jgi:uncharacterized pyridoxal phosphate-dependent enzyme
MATYQDLGVKPFINASGTITTLGGSLMPSEVLQAMQEAATSFVDLPDLNIRAGDYLARRIGVEAAFISCGAASGMQLAAAACLTGTDKERALQLPRTEDWKNEFVISLVDSHTYIHQGMAVCGGKLVRVGSSTEVTTEDLLGGIGDRTAAVVHFLGKQSKEQLGEVIAGARERGVPVIVDAAAQLPPRLNLTEIAGMGAALVVFSGGKGMRGPQSSGLVVGQREMVNAVRMNASPFSAIGRGMKVGKEEIMGLVAAVERFLKGSDDDDRQTWERQASHIIDTLSGIPGVQARVLREGQQPSPDFAPRAYVDLEAERARSVIAQMRDGEPSIVIRGVNTGVVIDPMTLMPGEEETVARRLKEVLSA